jgi:hypothetical protein
MARGINATSIVAISLFALTTFGAQEAAFAQRAGGGSRGISIYGGLSWARTPRFLLDRVDSSATIGNTPSSSTTGSPRAHGMIGGELTVAVPVGRSISVLASVSYHRSSSDDNELPGGAYRSISAQTILIIPDETGIRLRQTQLTAVAGAEYRLPRQAGHVSPFLRLQAGLARVSAGGNGIDQQRADINGLDRGRVSATSFTANFGAGVDLPIGRNLDLRLIQVDYRYVASASRRLVSNGDRVDSNVSNFTGGSMVTSLQDVDARVSARHDIVVGAGIVLHLGS